MTTTTTYQPLGINKNMNINNDEDDEHIVIEALEPSQVIKQEVLLFRINPEYIRILAYINFWIMILFSIIITKVFVDPELLINNPLDQTFGYSNICLSFDFPPA